MKEIHEELKRFLAQKNYVSPWITSDQPLNSTLASSGSIITIKKKNYLFLQGESNHNIYIVRTGRLRIFYTDSSGAEKCVYIVEKCSMIGDVSSFDSLPNHISAYAITDATLIKIHIQDFLRVINLHPELSLSVIRSLNYKVRLLTSQMEYSSRSASVRVAATLIAMCARYGVLQPDGSIRISIRFTHEEMSNLINLNRVTVSKAFQELVREKIVTGAGGLVTVLDIERLKGYLDGIN